MKCSALLLQHNSNTTLVKVKCFLAGGVTSLSTNSNTTLVKVKSRHLYRALINLFIQIQHLLKLNARKINLYDFHYTIKSIDTQGF